MKLLSIIVPTKDRYSTLLPLLDYLIKISDNDFEIVVQDNSSDNEEILAYLKKTLHNEKIRYFYNKGSLSVIENSDLAVANSSGEYVCFIGDDDGVMPYITDVARWMKESDFKALKSVKPNYSWPNQKSNFLSNDVSGILKSKQYDYKYTLVPAEKALSFALKKGGTTMDNLPCLYHGIVNRRVLDQIYEQCRTYFPGPSPDMANAIALTSFMSNHIYVHFPVIISGKSTKSTGGQGILHKHIARIEEVKHLPADTAVNWSDKIPKYWTGPTIWAESIMKALDNCGQSHKKNEFEYTYLYAYLYVFNFSHRKDIFSEFNLNTWSLKFLVAVLKVFFFRVAVFVDNRIAKRKKHNGVENIGAAIDLLMGDVEISRLPFPVLEN